MNTEDKDEMKLTEDEYNFYRSVLLSEATNKEELEKVCMELAHKGSKNAIDLLHEFKDSKRASEVDWIDCAIEEGKWWYYEPENEREEKDYLTLKIMQEIEDEIVEIEIELNDYRLKKRYQEIEHKAIRDLIKKNEINKDQALGLDDLELINNEKIKDLEENIKSKYKIFDQIKSYIKTDRYKDIDLTEMRSVHFTR